MKWFTKKEFECAEEVVPVEGREVIAYEVRRRSKKYGVGWLCQGFTANKARADSFVGQEDVNVSLVKAWQLPDGTLVAQRAVTALRVLL